MLVICKQASKQAGRRAGRKEMKHTRCSSTENPVSGSPFHKNILLLKEHIYERMLAVVYV